MVPRPKQQQQQQPSGAARSPPGGGVVTRGALRRARQAAATFSSPHTSEGGGEPEPGEAKLATSGQAEAKWRGVRAARPGARAAASCTPAVPWQPPQPAYWPPAPYGPHAWTVAAPRSLQAPCGPPVPGGASAGPALPHPPACREQQAALTGPGPGAESKAKAPLQPGPPAGRGGATEPPGRAASQREPRAKRGGKRQCWASDVSSEEEEEEGEEEEGEVSRGTRFWMEGAFIPPWMLKRREKAWKYLSKRPGPKEPPLAPDGDQEGPGAHLPRKLRERALDGYFVDVFDMIRPLEGVAGARPGREGKGKEPGGPERSFHNWLRGYAEYAVLISAAYPERGWHLARHLCHVLEARELAGESAAMAYDYAFRVRTSRCPRARWDQKHRDTWLLMVGPYIKPKLDSDSDGTASEGEGRRVCWDFNDGNCMRRHCKFEHVCESCFGSHPKVACV